MGGLPPDDWNDPLTGGWSCPSSVNVLEELLDWTAVGVVVAAPCAWPGTVAAATTENTATMPAAQRKHAQVRSLSFCMAWSRWIIASIGSAAIGSETSRPGLESAWERPRPEVRIASVTLDLWAWLRSRCRSSANRSPRALSTIG